jgi:protein-S-isoprenylcysteine O-methyltransferase Ste14
MFQASLGLFTLSLFLLVGIVFRVAVHRVRYGGTGVALFRAPGLAVLAIAFPLVALAQAIVAFVAPDLVRAHLLVDSRALAIAGSVLALVAGAAMALAQSDLGASWRIGIEDDARPGLVTSGLYRFSRNPIFSFMLAAILGLALTMPTLLSLLLFKAAVWIVVVQVAREEEYLSRAYGAAYAAYASRVGRFFPRLL